MGAQKITNIFSVKREIDLMLSAVEKDDFSHESLEYIAKRVSDLGDIATRFVSGRLKKTSDKRAIEKILYVIELLNDYSYVEILKEMLVNESSLVNSETVKIELLATLKSYDSHCLSNPFNQLFSNPHSALQLWMERSLEDFDTREYRVISLLEEFLTGHTNNIEIIKNVKKPLLGNAISFLALLADTDNDEVSAAALKELGKIKDNRAVSALIEIVKYSWREDLLDGALKALRRLSFSGYETTQTLAVDTNHEIKDYKAFIGPVDVMGNFNLCLSVKGEKKGVEAVCLIVNDEFGLLEVYGAKEISEQSFMNLIDEAADGEAFIPVDIKYFLELTNFAIYLNEKEDTPLPPEFHFRKGFLKKWLKPEMFKPKFDKEIVKEILKDKELVKKGPDLFDKSEFFGWKISTSALYSYAEKMDSSDRTPDKSLFDKPPFLREKTVLDAFCREVIVPQRKQLVRRLFLIADFFVKKSGYDESTRIILATALHIGSIPDALWSHSPFITRLAMESILYGSKILRDGLDVSFNNEEPDTIDE